METLQNVPLDSPLRPASNVTSSDEYDTAAPAPVASLPPSATGIGRPSSFTKPGISSGFCNTGHGQILRVVASDHMLSLAAQ